MKFPFKRQGLHSGPLRSRCQGGNAQARELSEEDVWRGFMREEAGEGREDLLTSMLL